MQLTLSQTELYPYHINLQVGKSCTENPSMRKGYHSPHHPMTYTHQIINFYKSMKGKHTHTNLIAKGVTNWQWGNQRFELLWQKRCMSWDMQRLSTWCVTLSRLGCEINRRYKQTCTCLKTTSIYCLKGEEESPCFL